MMRMASLRVRESALAIVLAATLAVACSRSEPAPVPTAEVPVPTPASFPLEEPSASPPPPTPSPTATATAAPGATQPAATATPTVTPIPSAPSPTPVGPAAPTPTVAPPTPSPTVEPTAVAQETPTPTALPTVGPSPTPEPPAGVGVYLSTQATSVGQGESFVVTVEVEPVGLTVTGVQVTVGFQTELMSVDSLEIGDLLGSEAIIGQQITDSTVGEIRFAAATTQDGTIVGAPSLVHINGTALQPFDLGGDTFTVQEALAIDEVFQLVQDVAILDWR